MYVNIELKVTKHSDVFNKYIKRIIGDASSKNEAIALLEFELLMKP